MRDFAPVRLDGSPPSCSVIICTRNRPELLDACVNRISGLDYPDFEVLVVDSASSDSRTREVAERWGVRYVREPIPGLSRARNRGLMETRSCIQAFLDDDAEAEPQWLSELVREFADPKVAAVTGRILPLNPDSEGAQLCARIGMLDYGDKRRFVDLTQCDWFQAVAFGLMGTGGNMALRRGACSGWGGFDPRLGRGAILQGCEEHYALFALVKRGFRVVYSPQATVRHPFPETLADVRAKYLATLTEVSGYLTFLLFKQPRYSPRTLEFIFNRILFGGRQSRLSDIDWRRIAGYRREMLAGLKGLQLFLRSLLYRSDSGEFKSPVPAKAETSNRQDCLACQLPHVDK